MAQTQRISDVPLSHIPFVWPNVHDYVRRALDEDVTGRRYEPGDIRDVVMSGQAKLWVAFDTERHEFDAAMVTEIIDYPQSRECRIWLTGGNNMKLWLEEWVSTVAAYARHHGCARLATCGRKGWLRATNAKSRGLEMVKEL